METNAIHRKLQIKPNQRWLVVNSPADYLEKLNPLPENILIVTEATNEKFEYAQIFANNKAELENLLPTLVNAITADALLWIAYKKGGKKANTDLNRDILWELLSKYNLTGVSLVALDDTWSAMRFRPPEKVGK